MRMIISTIGALLLAIAVGQGSSNAQAQGGGTQIVVPYGPGGLPDLLARVVGQKMGDNNGSSFVVENKAGGSGIIGAQYFLSRARPDGKTIFLIDNNTDAINAAIYPKLPYDPARDFAVVGQAVQGPMYLVANASTGINSVRELVERAKKSPGSINYGSPGVGTLHHLGMEQFAKMADIRLTHIPYRGVQQATPALLRGEVTVMFAARASVASLVESGQLRILAVGSWERSPLTPEVPTMISQGYPGLVVLTNMGFAVTAGTPAEIVTTLNAELMKALEAPDVRSSIERLGVQVVTGPAENFAKQLASDRRTYSALARDINLTLD